MSGLLVLYYLSADVTETVKLIICNVIILLKVVKDFCRGSSPKLATDYWRKPNI